MSGRGGQAKRGQAVWAWLLALCLLLSTATLAKGQQALSTDFTMEELLADYDQLWLILHESFPFLSLAGKSADELEALRLENRALIGSRVRDLAGLYQVIDHNFRALDHIAHLGLVSPGSYQLRLAQADQLGGWPALQRLITDPQTQASYARLGSARPEATARPRPPLTTRYYEDARAAYIRFPTFFHEPVAEEPLSIPALLAAYPQAEHLIIDITGNSGGHTNNWIYPIVGAFAEPVDWTITDYLRLTERIRPQYAAVDMQPLPADDAALPAFVKDLGLTHQAVSHLRLPDERPVGEQVRRPVRRWLLVDEGVYSAAENLTVFCLRTGWASVVGRRTWGDGMGRMPVTLRLDHTGLLLRFSVETGANADGTPNAILGSLPDFISKPNESPLVACLRLIRSGK